MCTAVARYVSCEMMGQPMLSLHVNAQDVVATLDNVAVRQIPFTLSRALNQTALDFQVVQRAAMGRTFTLRRQQFIEREGVKLLNGFARKDNLSVTIGVSDKAGFLTKFELGGEKFSIRGGLIAVPVNARRTKTDVIQKSQRPAALFADRTDVFEIRPGESNHLAPGIYQRVGGKKNPHLSMLYALFPETHISALLDFEINARRTVDQRWAINFSKEFGDALRTAH